MSTSDSNRISRLFSNHIQFFRDLISSFFLFYGVSLIYNKLIERKILYFIFAVLKQAIILLTSSFSLKAAGDGPWSIFGLFCFCRKAITFFRNLSFCLEACDLHIMDLLAEVQRAFWAQATKIAGLVSSCTKRWRSCLKYLKELLSLHRLWTSSPHFYITFSSMFFLYKLLLVLSLIKSWFILQLSFWPQDFPPLLLF